jgi:hypothetical protein
MPKDKLGITDWAAAGEGITTPAMQQAQNEAIRNVVNGISNEASRVQEAATKATQDCIVKHTLIGGSDATALACVATGTVKNYAMSHVRESAESQVAINIPIPCVILKIDHIEYDNPFLSQHSPEGILDIYRSGGIEAVNAVLALQGNSGVVGDGDWS